MDVKSQLQLQRKAYSAGTMLTLSGVVDGCGALDMWNIDAPVVVIDLVGVTRVTSFGARRWLENIEHIQAGYLAFTRCTPAIIDMFALVRGSMRHGEILSLLAPYECRTCNELFEAFIDMREHHASIVKRTPPHVPCLACGAEAAFDGIPQRFFACIHEKAPDVPKAAEALVGLVASPSSGLSPGDVLRAAREQMQS
jgi:hypothetical protein